ncbi:minor capsid protein [Lonepinella sp. BR2930]|uniref:minor capsid protein n=1 Tax=Lonepinella sp. BR2930 TaxID=3434554 RepID=UPI003F6E1EA1
MTDSAQTKTVKKTKTLDEEIESRLADRKIALFRYDAHLRQQIYKKLTALQKRLLNRVTAAGIESISKKELNLLLKDITKLINESYADVSEFSRDELNQLLPVEIVSTQQIYNKAVKFDLFNSVPDYKIKAIQNSQLIAGSPLESWWTKQSNELNFKFSNIIRQGMLDGKATSELILESKNLLASSKRWAETLVRTAVMKVHDQAQQALRDENLDIIKGEQHISTLDTRTSEVCRVRDGKSWDLNKKPIGDHDLPYQRPPIHPGCRSTLRLITKSWQELGIDAEEIPESTKASMDGQVKESLNYEDWLKGKSPEEQDAVLGKGKADLWRRGVITFRDMLDQSGRPLTLAQLQDFHQIPETVRKIRRTHWNDSFKNKAEAMYNDFKKSNITLDFHAVQRLAQRIDQNSDDYNEVKRMILNDKPNYIEPETGNLVRYNQSKGLAIIQSISDNEIITVVTDRYKPKQVWKKIN